MNNYKLPDFCNYVMGQSPSSQFYNSNREGLPFLQGCTTFGRMFPTFDTWTTQYTRTCKPNDVLMSVRAPVGDLNISRDVIALGRGVAALSMKQGDNRYLYYLLMANRQKLSSCSTGTIYESISKTQLENIVFDVHEPEEQRHIVDILGTLDSKIEDNDKENMHLENLFYQLWVKHFQNKSFEKLPLGSVLNIKYGRNLPTTQLQNTGYVVYGGNGTIGFFSSYMYEKPKVLVSCRGAASGNVIYSQPYSFITNNSLILEDNLNITYPYLRGLVKDLHFEKYTTGSAQPQITIDNISSIEIPVPPIELQSNFEIVTQPILDKLENLRTNNEKLNELKTLYLIKFFG